MFGCKVLRIPIQMLTTESGTSMLQEFTRDLVICRKDFACLDRRSYSIIRLRTILSKTSHAGLICIRKFMVQIYYYKIKGLRLGHFS